MNNEIKEILYVLRHIVIGRASRLTPREAKTLLDHITNLQQENDKLLNENIVIKDVKYMVDETIYKSRCEKAIEYIKENKVKAYPPYGDNEDTDYDICLVEREINELLNILQNGDDKN